MKLRAHKFCKVQIRNFFSSKNILEKAHNHEDMIKKIIQVNHAGEHGAVQIYSGQIFVSKLLHKELVPWLTHLREHEKGHLHVFDTFRRDMSLKPCGVILCWDIGGFVLGSTTALLGKNALMVCTDAVESAVDTHMEHQTHYLKGKNKQLMEAIQKIRVEEEEHRDEARKQFCSDSFPYDLLNRAIQSVTHAVVNISYRM